MLVIITVAFFMMRAAPGNPYSAERMLTPEVEANLKASLGLDKPLHEQYFEYLGKVVQGDLGPSMKYKDKTVSELLGEGLPVSLTIGALAITIAHVLRRAARRPRGDAAELAGGLFGDERRHGRHLDPDLRDGAVAVPGVRRLAATGSRPAGSISGG